MKKLSLIQHLNTNLMTEEPALNLFFSELCSELKYNKNEPIYLKGKIPQYLCYLQKGNALALSNAGPHRQVLRIWIPGQFICPIGFFNHAALTHSIIALDNCTVQVLGYRQLYRFLNEFPAGYKIINAIIREEINLLKLNIMSLQQNKGFQNHEAFLEALSVSFNE
ncbi:Cyclic nucleotide-binding domain protein [compost metagenome]